MLNLLQIHAKFSEHHTVVLTGIGGIGKTHAAVEYIGMITTLSCG